MIPPALTGWGILYPKNLMKADASFVPFRIFGLSQKVINGHVIEIGQFNKHAGGNVPLSQFVVAVNLLRTI